MTPRDIASRRSVYRSGVALSIAGGCLVALWLSLRVADPFEPALRPGEREPSAMSAEGATQSASLTVIHETTLAVADDLPSAGHGVADGLVPSHPITAQHEWLRRERRFIALLDHAVDRRNGAALRETLSQYRREYPEDEQRLQQGYAVIADCIEQPSEATRAAAQLFHATRRGSSLRRWVRLVCLAS